MPLINGSDVNFSHPYVLTYPGGAYPTDKPRPQLFVTNLTGFSNGTGNNPSGVNDNQLWGFGPRRPPVGKTLSLNPEGRHSGAAPHGGRRHWHVQARQGPALRRGSGVRMFRPQTG